MTGGGGGIHVDLEVYIEGSTQYRTRGSEAVVSRAKPPGGLTK